MQRDARAKAKAEAEKQEAAKKEIAELMAKAAVLIALDLSNVFPVQGDARAKAKAEAEKQEAAKKSIAELMAKAKADMDKEQKGDAQEAQAEADDLKKEVWHLTAIAN